MKLALNQRSAEIIALIIIFLSATLVFLNLTRGHVWGDDFAGYINQANVLLVGESRSIIEINKQINLWSATSPGPDAYPWGYPLLLSPVLAVFGLSALALKLLNLFFWMIGLFFVYQFINKRLPITPGLITFALIAFSPLYIQMNDYIQSDLPFFCLVFMVFWLMDRFRPTIGWAILLGVVIFVSTTIRTTGVLLWMLLLPKLFTKQTNLEKTKTILLSVLIAAVMYLLMNSSLPSGESSYFSHFKLFSWSDLWWNARAYFWAGSGIFGSSTIGVGFYFLAFTLFLFNQKSAIETDFGIQLFLYANLGILLIWPEDQGARFLLPILPIFLIRAFEGIEKIAAKFGVIKPFVYSISLVGMVVLFITNANSGVNNIRSGRDINGPFDNVSREAFNAVKDLTSPDDVLAFFKPRAALLFTQRLSYAADSCEGLVNANYVLIHLKQADNLQIDPAAITSCSNVEEEPIFENKRFALYAIDPNQNP